MPWPPSACCSREKTFASRLLLLPLLHLPCGRRAGPRSEARPRRSAGPRWTTTTRPPLRRWGGWRCVEFFLRAAKVGGRGVRGKKKNKGALLRIDGRWRRCKPLPSPPLESSSSRRSFAAPMGPSGDLGALPASRSDRFSLTSSRKTGREWQSSPSPSPLPLSMASLRLKTDAPPPLPRSLGSAASADRPGGSSGPSGRSGRPCFRFLEERCGSGGASEKNEEREDEERARACKLKQSKNNIERRKKKKNSWPKKIQEPLPRQKLPLLFLLSFPVVSPNYVRPRVLPRLGRAPRRRRQAVSVAARE